MGDIGEEEHVGQRDDSLTPSTSRTRRPPPLFLNDFPVNTLIHLCTSDFSFRAYCRLGKSVITEIDVFHFGRKPAKIRKKAEKRQNEQLC